ncbi:hypothetical protein GCM10011317_31960 [Niveispirillum cyanobacteriorum]|nr:hypothetical protein GCM10011317_31960 [Niveispirillum cyanobacteriorum]
MTSGPIPSPGSRRSERFDMKYLCMFAWHWRRVFAAAEFIDLPGHAAKGRRALGVVPKVQVDQEAQSQG